MRELHISIAYYSPTSLLGTLRELHHAKRSDANQNCIICRVAPEVSDDATVEKVRGYFLNERGNKPHEFELRLGHNERKEGPHRDSEPELLVGIDGVVFKPSVVG